jgi:hypothetical protein
MNQYLIFAVIFIALSFSILYVPFGYAQDNKTNSFTYYEKNCNNDACVVTTCSTDKPCSTTGVNNSTNNNTQELEPKTENSDSSDLDMMKFWENFPYFERE